MVENKKEQTIPYRNGELWGHGICEDPTDKRIETDPNGSYTGRPKDPYEKPIQDVDDL